jgi:hypothetical protein
MSQASAINVTPMRPNTVPEVAGSSSPREEPAANTGTGFKEARLAKSQVNARNDIV